MISSVTVGTTETQVLAQPANHAYKFVAISNVGEALCYLKIVSDDDALTTLNGIPLASKAAFVVDQDAQRELFSNGASAITSSGTTTISVQAF